MMPVIDPVASHAIAGAVALVLAVGAGSKFADLDGFAWAVERYRLVPPGAARLLGLVLPVVEALAAILLIVPAARGAGAALGAALVAIVTAAVVINLLRGHTDIDCGCGGSSHRQRLRWWIVVRNSALLAGCLLASLPVSSRAPVWLDAFTATFAAAALWLVWAAADELFSDPQRWSSQPDRLQTPESR